MQIKIGDKIYSGNDQPIMVILTEEDKKNIANMPDEFHKYCAYPNTMTKEEIDEFMDVSYL